MNGNTEQNRRHQNNRKLRSRAKEYGNPGHQKNHAQKHGTFETDVPEYQIRGAKIQNRCRERKNQIVHHHPYQVIYKRGRAEQNRLIGVLEDEQGNEYARKRDRESPQKIHQIQRNGFPVFLESANMLFLGFGNDHNCFYSIP